MKATETKRRGKLRPVFVAAGFAVIVSVGLPALACLSFPADQVPTWLLFLGRFHPVLLHFPIGLLVGVVLIEVLDALRANRRLAAAAITVLAAAAVSAAVTASLGLLAALDGGYDDALLLWHRRLGIALAAGISWALTLRLLAAGCEGKVVCRCYGLLLAALALLLMPAGHLGGSLTHGRAYLLRYLPPRLAFWRQPAAAEPTGLAKPDFYRDVKPLLGYYCYECHGVNKTKGKVDLEALRHESDFAGKSKLIGDMTEVLEAGDMPPRKAPRHPSDAQRKALIDWLRMLNR